MDNKRAEAHLTYQLKALELGILIKGLNMAQTKAFREQRIKELKEQLKPKRKRKT